MMNKRRDKNAFALEARQKIDRHLHELQIFRRPFRLALFNYIAAGEMDYYVGTARIGAAAILEAHRRFVESSCHAVPLIFQRCKVDGDEEVGIREEVFHEATDLWDYSWKYENIQYCFQLVDRGQFDLFVGEKDPRITFAYASEGADVLETEIRSGEISNFRLDESDQVGESVERLLKTLEPLLRVVPGDRCEYEYSDALLRLTLEYGMSALQRTNPLEIPSETRFGTTNFGDLRNFWATLIGMTQVHLAAHTTAARGVMEDLPFNTAVHCRAKDQFISLITRISGLSETTVERMLKYYSYQPDIAQGMPILQPFLPVTPSRVCLPSLFVNGNNFERNFRKLANRHPELREAAREVEDQLESIALFELSGLFPEPTFVVRRQVVIPGVTDADLVVFDYNSKFALIVEHKWFIAPDTLLESSNNDEKLLKGVRQAEKALEVFSSDLALFRQKMDFSSEQQIEGIQAVAVCRGLEHTGFIESTAVPVVTEADFRRFIDRAPSVKELWKLLETRPDRAGNAAKTEEMKSSMELAGYEFVMPGLAVFG